MWERDCGEPLAVDIRPNDLGIQKETSTTVSESMRFIEDTEQKIHAYLGAKKGKVLLEGNQNISRRLGGEGAPGWVGRVAGCAQGWRGLSPRTVEHALGWRPPQDGGADTAQRLGTAPRLGLMGVDGFSARSPSPGNFGLRCQPQKLRRERVPRVCERAYRARVCRQVKGAGGSETTFRVCAGTAGSGRSFV